MTRYHAVKAIPDCQNNMWGVFDCVLGRLLGNGKNSEVRVSSESEAYEIIDIMLERVGA